METTILLTGYILGLYYIIDRVYIGVNSGYNHKRYKTRELPVLASRVAHYWPLVTWE